MEALIRELESLQRKPDLSANEVLGAIMASTIRLRDILDIRMIGMQSLAAAVALQPDINARKLHDDFIVALQSHFDSTQRIPPELRDIAAALMLSASDRG